MKVNRLLISILSIIALAAFAWSPEEYHFPKLDNFPAMPRSEYNEVSVEGVELGRHLFYDPILSIDSTISCASCHKQEFAFSDGGKRLSTGVSGQTQRNALPLFNLAWYPKLFWDGRAESIEAQASFPITDQHEMGMNWPDLLGRLNQNSFYRKGFREVFNKASIDSAQVVMALAQFERSLISYRSKYDSVLNHLAYYTPDERRGFVMANDQSMADCMQCHITDAHALGTNMGFSNNGLDTASTVDSYPDRGLGGNTNKQEQIGQFKVPSLRNIAVTGPYMHDGRFETLEEVLEFYVKGVHESVNIDSKMALGQSPRPKLSKKEQEQIIAFLRTLTDYEFLNDQRHSNPFKSR